MFFTLERKPLKKPSQLLCEKPLKITWMFCNIILIFRLFVNLLIYWLIFFISLYLVVYHHGKNAAGGHYTAAVHHGNVFGWVHFDDNNMKPVNVSHVLKHQQGCVPYLLFYEQIQARWYETLTYFSKLDFKTQNVPSYIVIVVCVLPSQMLEDIQSIFQDKKTSTNIVKSLSLSMSVLYSHVT